ncbi:MAG TPA: hypothetical protein VM144_00985 [Aestuariivirga sp.]|nr:hypothetical protein [Aestuariivirga sp.]
MGAEGFLDLLALVGFGSPAFLTAVMRGWQALLDVLKPQVIVADHAPALAYLGEALGLPVVHVGTAFTLPPVLNSRFVSLRPDRSPLVSERRLLQVLSQVLGELGVPRPVRLTSAYEKNRVICSVPELDPFAPSRREASLLPLEQLPLLAPMPEEIRLFVYLDGSAPGIERVIHALAALNRPISAFLGNGTPTLLEFLRLRGHRVWETPPKLSDILPEVSHVLFHGGNFTGHSSLFAGRPQLIWPLHDEAAVNLGMMSKLGCATQIDPSAGDFSSDSLLKALTNHNLVGAALERGALVQNRKQDSSLPTAVKAVLSAAGRVPI